MGQMTKRDVMPHMGMHDIHQLLTEKKSMPISVALGYMRTTSRVQNCGVDSLRTRSRNTSLEEVAAQSFLKTL